MSVETAGLVAFMLVTIALVVLIVARPRLTTRTGGRALGFIGLFVLPIVATLAGTNQQLESAKTTEFCLSCHVMQPYGDSLLREDTDYLPAGHYQNNRIPTDQACYTCHTSYAMFGGARAKWKGVQHIWVNYLGEIPEELELYEPFSNGECLYCHSGGRIFEENELHLDDRAALAANEVSCLECHDVVHEVGSIHDAELWRRPRR